MTNDRWQKAEVRRRPRRVGALFLALVTLALAQAPQPPAQQVQVQTQPAPVPVGNINIPNGSLREVVNQLAQALKINLIPDSKLGGNVTINTYGELRNLDARNLLEMILRINGFGLAQEGDLYRIVSMKDLLKQPIPFQRLEAKDIPEDEQSLLNLIFLKYVTVEELTKVLDPFTGDNAVMLPYPPANLLFVLDSRRNMRRLMDLISMFDSDTFANQRVRLFELKNARPSEMEKSLESILQSISLDPKATTVKFLPVDKISTLIAVAPNPGVFDTVAQWIQKLDIPVTVNAGGIENYVYHVKYGRADCLAMALNSLFGAGGVYAPYGYAGAAPTPSYGTPYAYGNPYSNPYATGNGAYGAYGGAYGGAGFGAYNGGAYGGAYGGGGTYGAPNAFMNGFGGAGACGGGIPSSGGYGYPAFGGFSAQTPLVSSPPAQAAAPGGQATAGAAGNPALAPPEVPPRIVANPLDNSLIIQADPQRYQSIQKVLQELDVPPRQILLEARIYSIDLTDQFQSGVQAAFTRRDGSDTSFLGKLTDSSGVFGAGTLQLSAGALIGSSKQLLAFLNLNENRSHVHMLSEPSLIATDSIPAVINVGSQVPVSTATTTIPGSNGVNTVQNISGVSTGITLEVFAHINPSGVVTLIINQENSSVPAGNTSLTPTIGQQVVQTQVTTVDGDTIAIGGAIEDDTTSSMSGVPLLSRIPYLGALFGAKTYSHERKELILFMTPHVISDQTDLLEASNELRARVKKLQKYIKF
ncbi:MAG TPA: type II secretion system secretin GspD [Bryobacteraceae bacterium]|nr:type II secretion system secretin GspD [Bryobacteraceae bacterium]